MQDESTQKAEQSKEPERPAAESQQASDKPENPPENDNRDPKQELEELRDKLAESEAKAVENWERYLRATAEQDNIRKRSEREIDAARRFALEKFAQDLLAVWDSLELGLKSAREAGADNTHVEGVELTLRKLSETMQRHGVESIDPKGETFDPEKHEAMSAVPTNDAAPNTVLEVMQKGYTLNGRVLRPAMVVVSRAGDAKAS